MTQQQAAPPQPSAALARSVYWRSTEPVEPGPPLTRDVRCDVCIVGGGYTGLWTAHLLKLAEPALEVRVVEADHAGAGASGHNDGFVTPTIGHSLWTLVHRFGIDRARLAYTAVGRSIAELVRFCRKHDVDAELEPSGFLMVATNGGQVRRLERDRELAATLGPRFAMQMLDRDEARARIGSPAIEAAIVSGGALINPHKLVRGLARVVRDQGAEIHERTPVTGLAQRGGVHVVSTPLARVTASQVVLATNAYQHRLAPFRRQLKPVWSHAMVSEPVPDAWLEELPWTGREGFVEACNFILFARLTAGNRLLVGGGPAPYYYGRDMDERHVRNDRVEATLRAAFARFFPRWRTLRFTHAYGGCVAMTRNLVPHVGRLESGEYYGYGYCGNGIAATHTTGKALRDLVLERDSEYSRLLFVRAPEPAFPPEPLAYAGARALSAALAWQDRHPRLAARQLV